MGSAIPFAVLLGIVIAFVEITRRRAEQVDFLLPVSALFFLCFVLVPIVLPVYKYDSLGAWSWLFERDLDGWPQAVSVILALLLYSIVAWIYLVAPRDLGSILSPYTGAISFGRLTAIGLALLAISLAAIGIFAQQKGDLGLAIVEAAVFKTSEDPLGNLAFAIKLSPFSTMASFIFWHLIWESRGLVWRLIIVSLFIGAVLTSMLGLFLLGGRVSFIFFILTFVLGEYIYRRRKLKFGAVLFVLMAVAMPVILFGKVLLRAFGDDSVLDSAISDLMEAPSDALRLLVLEFSFPWVNVANLLVLSPDQISFRWFVDVPVGVAYLLPKLLLELQLPPTVNEIYDRLVNSPVPIDLTSFGYVSAGVGGVLIVAVCFGLVLRFAEGVFSRRESRLWCLLRATWILVLGAQVMYGSPYHFLLGAFTLIIGTAVLFLASPRSGAPRFWGVRAISARTVT